MTTDTDNKQALQEYLDSLGLTYTATFVPTPQPKDKVKDPQLHWSITLQKGNRSASFPYFQGIGHVQDYKQFPKTLWGEERAERFRKTCETGKLFKHMANTDWYYPAGNQPAPKLADVLYCLIADSSVLNYATYEEWASEFGYDPDSRKGEKIYRQCLEQTLALKGILGMRAIERLQELFQDY